MFINHKYRYYIPCILYVVIANPVLSSQKKTLINIYKYVKYPYYDNNYKVCTGTELINKRIFLLSLLKLILNWNVDVSWWFWGWNFVLHNFAYLSENAYYSSHVSADDCIKVVYLGQGRRNDFWNVNLCMPICIWPWGNSPAKTFPGDYHPPSDFCYPGVPDLSILLIFKKINEIKNYDW